jgi:hypothetical protein
MDQVLLTFGFLTMKYRDEKMNHDPIGRDAIIKSVELRWSKSDQEVFIAAVLANPFYRTSPFAPLPVFSKAHIRVLFTKLYRRFFQVEPPGRQPNSLSTPMIFWMGQGSSEVWKVK